MTPVSLELQARITEWRRQAADGTLGLEEMKEVVKILRQGRLAASSAAKRSAAVKAIPNADAFLNEFLGEA